MVMPQQFNPQNYVSPTKGFVPGLGAAMPTGNRGFLSTLMGVLSANGSPLAKAYQQQENLKALDSQYRYQIQQEESQRQYDQAVAAAKAQDAAGVVKGSTGLNVTGYGGIPDSGQLQAVMQSNQNPNIQNMLQGQPLQQDQYGAYDPQLMKDYMARVGKVADSQATLGTIPSYVQNPGFLVNTPFGKTIVHQMKGKQSSANTPIQAGISSTNISQNPYMIGAPEVQQLIEARKNEQANNVSQGQLVETQHHNRAEESIGKSNATSDRIRANKYFVPDHITSGDILAKQSPETQKKYFEKDPFGSMLQAMQTGQAGGGEGEDSTTPPVIMTPPVKAPIKSSISKPVTQTRSANRVNNFFKKHGIH